MIGSKRFSGNPMTVEMSKLLTMLLRLCAAALAEHLNDTELKILSEYIFEQLLGKDIKPDAACMYIQLLGSVRCVSSANA